MGHKKPRTMIVFLTALLVLIASAILFGIPLVRHAMAVGQVERTRVRLSALARASAEYFRASGFLPTEADAATVEALCGVNPSGTEYLEVEPGWTNAEGALVDMWGTTPRLTLNTLNEVLAQSAGPNGAFGDHDDLACSADPRRVGSTPSNPEAP